MKLKNIRTWYLYILCAIFAFGGFISFANIEAYYWDSRGLGWVMWTTGIISTLIAIYFLYLVNKKSNPGLPDK